jgi:hypothetical protein
MYELLHLQFKILSSSEHLMQQSVVLTIMMVDVSFPFCLS